MDLLCVQVCLVVLNQWLIYGQQVWVTVLLVCTHKLDNFPVLEVSVDN